MSDQISFSQFARLAVVCGIAGILIGFGWAWIMSTPIYQVTYAAETANSSIISMNPWVRVTATHLSTGQGFVILLILIVTGSVLGIAARKVQEWNQERLGEQEEK